MSVYLSGKTCEEILGDYLLAIKQKNKQNKKNEASLFSEIVRRLSSSSTDKFNEMKKAIDDLATNETFNETLLILNNRLKLLYKSYYEKLLKAIEKYAVDVGQRYTHEINELIRDCEKEVAETRYCPVDLPGNHELFNLPKAEIALKQINRGVFHQQFREEKEYEEDEYEGKRRPPRSTRYERPATMYRNTLGKKILKVENVHSTRPDNTDIFLPIVQAKGISKISQALKPADKKENLDELSWEDFRNRTVNATEIYYEKGEEIGGKITPYRDFIKKDHSPVSRFLEKVFHLVSTVLLIGSIFTAYRAVKSKNERGHHKFYKAKGYDVDQIVKETSHALKIEKKQRKA